MKDFTSSSLLLNKGFKLIDVIEVRSGEKTLKNISIAEEIPLTIYINEKEIVTLLCTNADIEDLVAGFLASEGFIKVFKDIRSVKINEEKGIALVATNNEKKIPEKLFSKRLIATGCGKGAGFYNFLDPLNIKKFSLKDNSAMFSDKEVFSLMDDFLKLGTGYKKTTATHSAALADRNGIIAFKEDIGRHNALDKIFGWLIKKKIETKNLSLLTTGRITSEMLIKAGKMGTAVVISRSSPSVLALSLGNALGITIIGRVKKDSFIVYTHDRRVL